MLLLIDFKPINLMAPSPRTQIGRSSDAGEYVKLSQNKTKCVNSQVPSIRLLWNMNLFVNWGPLNVIEP